MGAQRFFFVLSCILLVACHPSRHHYQGYIEGETLYLSIPFSGVLQKMHVHRGQQVSAGQLLFEFNPKPQEYALTQNQALLEQSNQTLIDLQKPKRIPEIDAIKAQIAQSDAQLSLADLRVKRNQILFDKHVMDKDTLDAAIEHLHEMQAVKQQYEANLALALLGARPNQIDAQQAAMNAQQAMMQQARWNLDQKNIVAPSDGIIFDTYYRRGEFVSAEHPVASLLTKADTRIEFFVPLEGLKDLSLGKKITYTYPGSDDQLTAEIVYISPKAEYLPPLVYSRDNADKIVFRIKASTHTKALLISGAPVTVTVESQHVS